MPVTAHPKPICMHRLVLRLGGALACSALLGGGLVAVLMSASGQEATLGGSAGFGAALGAGCLLVGGLLGLAALFSMADGSLQTTPAAVLASSSVRLVAGLGLGLAAWLAFEPAARPFWFAFLFAGGLALALETMISTSALRAATAPGGQPLESAR